MSRKQKNKSKETHVSNINKLMERYPEPLSLKQLAQAARPMVEYHDAGDGTLLAWCPAVILIRLNPATRTVTHLYAHTETPPPKGLGLEKPEYTKSRPPTRPSILE